MKRKALGLMFLAATSALAACADDLGEAEEAAQAAASVPEVAALQEGGTTAVKDPNGVTFGSVQAAGRGCPRGSWVPMISSDGETFTLSFNKFELASNAKTASNVTIDCTIVMTLNTPPGISYAVTDLTYVGYAFLAKGLTATQRSYYAYGGLGGATVNGSSLIPVAEHLMTGPYDQEFRFQDKVETSNLNWSECGRQRNLQVRTNLTIRNPSRTGDGYINVRDLNGSTESKLIVKFGRRTCP